MTDTRRAAAPARHASAARQARGVFRAELNPVRLLPRAAYMYPDRVAVAHGERRDS